MHKNLKAARRYAKSLLDFAESEKKLIEVASDMVTVQAVCRESADLVKFLKSPLIKADKKIAVLKEIFKGKIGAVVEKFMHIIVRKRREMIIPEIAASFEDLYREQQGIVLAEVTTAVPLDDALRAKVDALVKKRHDKVEIKESVNPDIIGGIVIKIGDAQYDDSILSRIGEIRLLQRTNPYVSQL